MSLGELSAEKEKKHEQMYYPTCKVKSPEASGSGVVIHSKEWYEDSDEHETEVYTYILTNHHVVESAIEVKKKWDSTLQKERKQEICEPVSIQLFEYNNYSRAVGSHSHEGDILAYAHSSDDSDLALIRLRDTEKVLEYTAELYPYSNRKDLFMFDEVHACGAALGFPVFQTPGEITNARYELNGQDYIGTNSAISFGSSGGGLFKKDEGNYYLIGLPARVAMEGWSPANHIGLCVPIKEIYSFLEENHFDHIWREEEFDPKTDREKRKEKIEKAKESS